MSIYSDKFTHIQVIINCLYSVAQFCTSKDTLAHISGAPSTDDAMSYDSLTTQEQGLNTCYPDILVS